MAKILVIEDNPELLNLYTEILSGAGYQIETALDGEIGQAKILQGGYDLILLDIMLPKIDGLQILKNIASQPQANHNGPILMLTALDQENLISHALASGASGYLVKSEVTPDKILKEIQNLLTPN